MLTTARRVLTAAVFEQRNDVANDVEATALERLLNIIISSAFGVMHFPQKTATKHFAIK
jgi:hypothetical protein